MAHVVSDRVRETSTTTSTGTLALGGAVSGYVAFSAVMANNDTTFYCIAHQTADEWEIGYGTWQTGNNLARTTVIRSTNADAAVNFSAGTKDVFITSPAVGQAWGLVVASPSTSQNNYAPAGLAYANSLSLTPTASIKLTGLTGGYYGRHITLHNDSTDYLVWLEHESASSTAANRFSLPRTFPAFMMPGDHITLHYDAVAQRWEVSAWPNQGQAMGLTIFSDMGTVLSAAAPTTYGSVGEFGITTAGTGTGAAASTYGVNTTEKVIGALDLTTGSTTTGRASIGLGGTAQMVPTLGCALYVARVAVQTAVDGTQTYSLISGFQDAAGGTWTDGVAWEYRWTGSAVEWSQTRMAGAAATRSNTGSPTADTTYIWTVVFMNAAWTRADFIYSQDSLAFTKSASPTTGIPGNTQYTSVGVSMIKSAGTTARLASVDLLGYRYDHTRG